MAGRCYIHLSLEGREDAVRRYVHGSQGCESFFRQIGDRTVLDKREPKESNWPRAMWLGT